MFLLLRANKKFVRACHLHRRRVDFGFRWSLVLVGVGGVTQKVHGGSEPIKLPGKPSAAWRNENLSRRPHADREDKRTRRDWLTAQEILMLIDLPETCDESTRVAGLSGWWSRRGLPVQRATLCLCYGFAGRSYWQFVVGCFFSDFDAFTELPGFPEEVQAGRERLSLGNFEQENATWTNSRVNCRFAHGTSVHARVMEASVANVL